MFDSIQFIQTFISIISPFFLNILQFPTTISVVNHLLSHATVDTNVFTCDETGLVTTKKQYHISNIHGISDTMNRLLHCICSCIFGKVSIYPSRRD